MADEYIIIKFLNNKTHNNLSPYTNDFKNFIFKGISENKRDEIINSLYERKFIQDKKENGRSYLTKDGNEYLDKTYYLLQAYDIVDIGLLKIESHNDAISINHSRGNHKIQQEAQNIIDEYGLVKYFTPSNKAISMAEIQKNGRKAIESGGIENYINQLNQKIKSNENKKAEIEDLQYQQLDFSVQELKKKLSNYENVERRGKDSLFMSKLSIGLSIAIPLILLLLKWQCNIPAGK